MIERLIKEATILPQTLKLAMRCLGGVLFAISLYFIFTFPVFNTLLFITAFVFFVLSILYHHFWLIILPFLLVGVDLTPWSGRYFFNELDFLLLVLMGGILVRPPTAL